MLDRLICDTQFGFLDKDQQHYKYYMCRDGSVELYNND